MRFTDPSPGYFVQQGQWLFVLLFAILLVLALVSARQAAYAVAKQS